MSWDYTRNPASQIRTETQSHPGSGPGQASPYSWDGHVDVTRAYTTNGLNQYESAGSASFCYDANGNLTADGTSVYLYDVENRLVARRVQTNSDCTNLAYTGTLEAELRYDPLGRIYLLRDYVGGNGITRFAYDNNAMIAEYNNGTTMLRRYVHGSNVEADDPLVWYEGSSTASTDARHLYADPRGSIVLVGSDTGTTLAINAYDEYGIPDTATGNDIATKGRFRYTGQAWLPELGMYHYKARIYSPTLGRFLQTDPIGYEDGFNLYRYVGNDPVNKIDPTGTSDLNLFHSTDTLWLAGWAFEPNREDDSIFTITGHGSAKGIRDNRDNGSGEVMTATQLATEARRNGLRQGMIAFLASCNCAKGNYARDFAIAAKTDVIAANGFVMFPSARKGFRPNTYNGKVSLYVSQTRDGKGPRGQFLQYNSKGRVTKIWDRATYNSKNRTRDILERYTENRNSNSGKTLSVRQQGAL